jgi:hypothetical protein
MHDLMATQVAADLLDCIDANHRGAMDFPEVFRLQLIEELLDRLAKRERKIGTGFAINRLL